MNIFILEHRKPSETIESWCKRIAESYCDQHVNKIISELRQMFYANLTALGLPVEKPTKGYLGHPCTKWLAASKDNWNFGVVLAKALDEEAKKRSGRTVTHKDLDKILKWASEAPQCLPEGFAEFALAIPDNLKRRFRGNPVEAYRAYYCLYKSWFVRKEKVDKVDTGKYIAYKSSWSGRGEPEWFQRNTLKRAIIGNALSADKVMINSKEMVVNYEELI